jgi:hypothetical protein
VAGTHVLGDLDRDFAVGEATDVGGAELGAQALGDLCSQHRVGVAGEDHEIRGLNLHGVLCCIHCEKSVLPTCECSGLPGT